MIEVVGLSIVALLLAWPIGIYLDGILSGRPHFTDRVFLRLEQGCYRLIGIDSHADMTWKTYALAFLWSNLVLGILSFLLLLFQHHLPLNPDKVGPLSWDLALHTAVSFLTNTNQQHYSGQAQLTYLSQSFVIVTLQFVTPAMALAVCAAVLRGMIGGRDNLTADESDERNLGNYYVDITRITLRVFLPLTLVTALCLASQGVPSTFEGAYNAQTLESTATDSTATDSSTADSSTTDSSTTDSSTTNSPATPTRQIIPVGPVAAMVAIKQLGSNGGGWYGPNSSNPLENPTPLSNAIETIALVLLPMAIVFMAGRMLRPQRFTLLPLLAMSALSVLFIVASVYSEQASNAAFLGLSASEANMEGKEVRFGSELSALWATLTTQTSNGSVNAMHDSLNPLAGLVTRAGMLINAIWGGIGCGYINFIVYVWIAVFLAGLMTGRTPEIFGRKIEITEITWLGVLMVLPSACILGFTAVTVAIPSLTGNSNPGFHGISQVFYEYTSAFANNGSGFEGLSDNTPWWNLSCVVVLILGRYLPLIIPLLIAGNMARKRVTPVGVGSLQLDSITFGVTLVSIIVILNFLSFLPSMVLGPIGEAIAL